MDKELKKKTVYNFIYAFLAQLVSILLSILMSLVVPKILGVEDFSYWQLFLFYASYVGFFHFGITDGMYLKNGGIDYDKLDKKEISSQFRILFLIQIIIVSIIIVISELFINNDTRQYILLFTGIYTIIANLNWFLGYIFQATNQIKKYSISVVIDKLVFLIFIVAAFIFKFKNLKLYIPIYVSTTALALIFSIWNSKEIIFTKPYKLKQSLKIAFDTSKVGIKLTISSIASMLVLGFGKFLIDKNWGITSFGKVSLALSLTNFFLLFISQISLVLFPTLRKLDKKVTDDIFIKFNNYLNLILPFIYVLYIPMKIILNYWIPNYSISLYYLGILLPICIFDGKMQMISNTYLKVLRKENMLLKFNLITVLLSIILSVVNVFVFKNMLLVIFGMLISIAIRSIISEIYLYKQLNIKINYKNIFLIIGISILFIIYNLKLDNTISFIAIIVTYLIYIKIGNLDKYLLEILNYLKIKIKKKAM